MQGSSRRRSFFRGPVEMPGGPRVILSVTLEMETTMTRTPLWYWAIATAGLIWNAYGTWQFALSLTATPKSLVASGLTPETC